MTKTKGVNHIHLTVRDISRSKEFYTKGCSMKIKTESENLLGLTDGKFNLWISTSRDDKPIELKFDRNQIGLDHFAFRVEKMDELKEIEKNLKAMDVELEEGGIVNDERGPAIFARDPDGMKVEFRFEK